MPGASEFAAGLHAQKRGNLAVPCSSRQARHGAQGLPRGRVLRSTTSGGAGVNEPVHNGSLCEESCPHISPTGVSGRKGGSAQQSSQGAPPPLGAKRLHYCWCASSQHLLHSTLACNLACQAQAARRGLQLLHSCSSSRAGRKQHSTELSVEALAERPHSLAWPPFCRTGAACGRTEQTKFGEGTRYS